MKEDQKQLDKLNMLLTAIETLEAEEEASNFVEEFKLCALTS